MPLDDRQIDQIAKMVVANLSGGSRQAQIAESGSGRAHEDSGLYAGSAELSFGVFTTIDDAVSAAKVAFQKLMDISLEKRGKIIANIRKRMMENVEFLAREAFEETGLGRYEDKIAKNILVIEKTPGTEELEPKAWSGDRGLTLMERAPFGVIGSLTPCTNPTSTIICNTIGMVAAGNTVVFNTHPTAKVISRKTVTMINEAIMEAGGPPNVITTIAQPTIPSAQALMTHPGIALLVVTGGGGVVKAAMSSGKRAMCAGPGNPPVVVDETADIERAADLIYRGASLDNNIICVDEKEVFVVQAVAEQLISAMVRKGAYLLTSVQLKQLERVIFDKIEPPSGHSVMNKDYIGKNANVILSRIGVDAPDSCRLIIAEVDRNHPLIWTEQMMPVLPIVRVKDADEAIDMAVKAEGGNRHSAVMHSTNLNNLSKMASVINSSIFVKNGMGASGLGYESTGFTSFTIASPTGEGLTSPVSFTRERRCVLKDYFRII